MAKIILDKVVLDYPIYGSQKSFRSALNRAAGGLIKRDDNDQKHISVRAIDNLSLTLEHGDRLGIIGHNGAGKSTLLRVCAGVYVPSQGSVTIEGKVSPLLHISPGMDHDDTGYENIVNCGLFLGMTIDEIREKTEDIAEFTELGEYLSFPVRTYSTGMITRLCFGIATAIDPGILILDEGLGAGDARFADKAKARLNAMIERTSILILASHSDALIKTMCNKAILMSSGKIIHSGTVDEVVDVYHQGNNQ